MSSLEVTFLPSNEYCVKLKFILIQYTLLQQFTFMHSILESDMPLYVYINANNLHTYATYTPP